MEAHTWSQQQGEGTVHVLRTGKRENWIPTANISNSIGAYYWIVGVEQTVSYMRVHEHIQSDVNFNPRNPKEIRGPTPISPRVYGLSMTTDCVSAAGGSKEGAPGWVLRSFAWVLPVECAGLVRPSQSYRRCYQST